jgi:hypothetical protein
MNATLSNIIMANLPKAIHKTYRPIYMIEPNMVFLYMFYWFITKHGKATTKNCKVNWKRMAANLHPLDSYKPLAKCLFIGIGALPARYPMEAHDIIKIGLRILKRCGMYSKE